MRFAIVVLCLALVAVQARPKFRPRKNRIVNGIDVKAGEIPWQVSFQDTSYIPDFHFCGGSVLNENWIICAAHCVEPSTDNPDPDYEIEGGMISLRAGGQERKVDAIIRNKNYAPLRTQNDISLIHVSEPFDLNDDQMPMKGVTLPSKMSGATEQDPYVQADFSESYPDSDWTTAIKGTVFGVTGWGTLEAGGSTPDIMQKVAVSYITDDVCNEPPPPANPSAGYDGRVIYSMICAGGAGGNHDSCQGDSGGPLNLIKLGGINGETDYTISSEQVGIVSWGSGCADDGYPGVYTQLAFFVDWIDEAIKCYADNQNSAANCG